jgi:hypothetical protein
MWEIYIFLDNDYLKESFRQDYLLPHGGVFIRHGVLYKIIGSFVNTDTMVQKVEAEIQIKT